MTTLCTPQMSVETAIEVCTHGYVLPSRHNVAPDLINELTEVGISSPINKSEHERLRKQAASIITEIFCT
ncbi:hypothetical protein KA005_82200 [bacterium]|nr:hypothetical protein [bacterium]